MKIYKVKFKSGIEALVRSSDLSEATDVHGEIEMVESTNLIIFDGRSTRATYYYQPPMDAETVKALPEPKDAALD